jgi:hypothetical protein
MKLTQNTLTLLQNFATIQPNVLLGQESGKLKTIAEAKNIFAVADIKETFDEEVGIYDLTELLSAITLIDDPEFTFGSKRIGITSNDGKTQLKYACANSSILTVPQKDITDPDYEVDFTLTVADILAIKKAASVLGHETFSFIKAADSDQVVVKVHDIDNSSSNAWESNVGTIASEAEFEFHFMINNLKIVSGSYNVALSSKLISRWSCAEIPVKYWIAIEHTSSYGA